MGDKLWRLCGPAELRALGEGLVNIGDEILDVFQADRDPDEAVRDADGEAVGLRDALART